MLIEMLVSFFCGALLNPLLEFLPTIDITGAVDSIDTITSILRIGMYFLPMGTVTTILGMIISLFVFRIGMAFLKTLWNFIPFV